MMKKSAYVKFRNSFHPGYSECSKCGGNWGWKKTASHRTSESTGLFLFCTDCDKLVTIKERWKALDEWKRKCLEQTFHFQINEEKQNFDNKYRKQIMETEFIEFPRPKETG